MYQGRWIILDNEVKHYTKDIEDLFITFFLTEPELFVRCLNIINPEHYQNATNKKVIAFISEHADEYTVLPTVMQIKAITGKEIELDTEAVEGHKEWFLDEYESFARHRQIELAVYDAPDLVEAGKYGEMETLVKEATALSLVKDLGTDYFADPEARLTAVATSGGTISTGFKSIDKRLYGGLNRGELTIFAGQSGAGKSLFLQNFAVNWAEMGLNVVYISLELNEMLCAMRLDAMITSYTTQEVLKNRSDVGLRVATFQKKNKGTLRIKQLKNGCTANDIKAFIKEYEIQTGVKVDAVLLDYLDLCMPTNVKVSPSDLFVKDKYVSENLRDLAVELDTLFVTASQLNRSSHEEVEFDHSHISGGISKINTADNVVGIFTTNTMRENGRYQIQFMKTRSSSGVGMKVDLGFNIKSLRIFDLPDDDPFSSGGSTTVETTDLVKKLRQSGAIGAEPKPESAQAKSASSVLQRSAELRNLLGKLDS